MSVRLQTWCGMAALAGVVATADLACGAAPTEARLAHDPANATAALTLTHDTVTITSHLVPSTGKACIDVPGGNAFAGQHLQTWSCATANANQKFDWRNDSTVHFKAYCVEGQAANGGSLTLQSCASTAAQKWVRTSGAQIRLRSTSYCMDGKNSSVANGNRIQIWGCWGGDNQLWDTTSAGTADTTPTTPTSDTTTTTTTCSAYPKLRTVNVSTSSQLASALFGAIPGDLIIVANGSYPQHFNLGHSGTSSNRITVCGTRSAVLGPLTFTSGNGFLLESANYVTLSGFTIIGAATGLAATHANHDIVENVELHDVNTGIHFHEFSTHDILRGNYVHKTGVSYAQYGNAFYIGSYHGDWCNVSACQPDKSDSIEVRNNIIGPGVTEKEVDVKEGTTGGIVDGNTIDGTGMLVNSYYVTSWVEVKGNNWTISNNTGVHSAANGYMTEYSGITGWSRNNLFIHNSATSGPNYGLFIRDGGTGGNVVKCDNTVTNFGQGYSNIPCKS